MNIISRIFNDRDNCSFLRHNVRIAFAGEAHAWVNGAANLQRLWVNDDAVGEAATIKAADHKDVSVAYFGHQRVGTRG